MAYRSKYYQRARAFPGIATERSAAAGYNYAQLNFNLSHPVLKDLAVRLALRLAIDRPLINRKIFRSLGVVQDNMISPTNPAFDPHVPTTPFDLAAANRLLDRAGWVRGADGIRRKGSLRLALLLPVSTGAGFGVDQMIELIRAWYRQIGVELDTKRYPTVEIFVPYGEGGILNTGNFDLLLWGTSDDPEGDLSGYSCSEFPPRGENYTRYCDRRVDAALDEFERLYTFPRAAAVRKLHPGAVAARPADDRAGYRLRLLGVQFRSQGAALESSEPVRRFHER